MTLPGGQLSIFVPINKIDEEQRLVYGQVAAEVMDNSGEMFDYAGSKPYFEKWSENAFATSGGKSKGNLRVMHTSKVAGIVTDIAFNDESNTIDACTKVVDDAEWAMVLAGGYTGFSMGGRYVSRATKSDGVKTYIADPVEISLVDKPCIPTATFSVVKADGLTETHRFREDLYKIAGEAPMSVYAPTNDEILPVAQALAKAAGQPDTAWLDFVAPATAELIAKHDAGGAAPVQKADGEHDPESCDKADCADCAAAKADKPNPFAGKGKDDKGDDDGKDEEDAKDAKKDKDAKKADQPATAELSQGWQAKDGSFHVRKADAIAHNESLTKTDKGEPSIVDVLKSAVADAAAIVTGGEAPAATEEAAEPAADAEITKYITLLDGAAPLAKGMYEVGRLAETLRSAASLQICCAAEAKREGDGSGVPATILDAVRVLGEALVAMAAEEVAELTASLAGSEASEASVYSYPDSYMELAASTLGLEKSALDTMSAERLAKRSAAVAVIDGEMLQKVTTLQTELGEAVAKSTRLETEMGEIVPLVKTLSSEIERIKALPMPKAPTMVVGKGESVEKADTVPQTKGDILAKFGPDALADAAIRMAHGQGRHFVLPQGNGQ